MYRLRGVSKFFAQGAATVRAVDGIDLDIGEGEFVVIEGPSGSGKSTLLQLLGGLDRPTGGELWFGGDDMAAVSDRDMARLRLQTFGFVFQQFNLLPTLTALENVEAALAPLGWKRAKARSRAQRLLDGVGLGDRVHHLPPQLSGGEQQRVAIARALTKGPKVILADEPTGNLDSRTGREIIDLLRRLSADLGQTVVVITHDPTIASQSPRVVQMRDGQIAGDVPGTALAGAGAAAVVAPGGAGAVAAPVPAGAGSVPTAAPVAPSPVATPVAAPPVAEADTGSKRRTEWVATDGLPPDDRYEILRAEGVRKVYVTGDTPVEVLKGLNLVVHEGEFVTVTGPSGSGKTTLLNCLSGLDRIDAGRVLVDGQAVHDINDAERSRLRARTMGFIFQAWNLVPVFSAVENTELPLLLGGTPAARARKEAGDTLERVGLGHRLNHRPGELSGGEQQRVAIARALANRPRLVWADEPTGNLDSETAEKVMRLLRDLHRDGLTVILVTHDESIAESGTRRIRMRDGVILGDHSKLRRGTATGTAPAGGTHRAPGPGWSAAAATAAASGAAVASSAPSATPATPAAPSAPAAPPAATPAATAPPAATTKKTMTKAERRAEKRRAAAARAEAKQSAPILRPAAASTNPPPEPRTPRQEPPAAGPEAEPQDASPAPTGTSGDVDRSDPPAPTWAAPPDASPEHVVYDDPFS